MGATGPGNWQRTLPPDPGALFAYGTLRFPEVLRELLGRVPELTEGTVADWRVAALTDAQLAKIVWDSVDIAELYDTDSVDVSTLRAALLTALGGNTK